MEEATVRGRGNGEREEGGEDTVLGSFDGMGIRSLFLAAICAVYFDGPSRPP